jgi:hypothetical protein
MKILKSILKSIKGIIISLIIVLVVIFMINNREIIEVNFNPLPFEKIQTRIFFFNANILLTWTTYRSSDLLK